MSSPPPPPESITLVYRGLESVVVRWAPPTDGENQLIGGYKVRLEYFDAHGSLLQAEGQQERQCGAQEMAAEFGFPESFCVDGGLKACTIKASIASLGGEQGSQEGMARSVTSTRDSLHLNPSCLEEHKPDLERACAAFKECRGRSSMNILILGPQHHGKSSLVNHLERHLRGNARLPDAMETAPAGVLETTVETASCCDEFGGFRFKLADYPALNSLSTREMRARLDAALANPIPDGTRRGDFVTSSSRYRNPPDAAILVVSLTHWVSQRSELVAYLGSFSERCRSASDDRVAFPYVVAVTRRDEFLEQRSYPALEEALWEICESANTNNVHILTSMQEGGFWSPEVAGETFKLVTNIVTFAKNRHAVFCTNEQVLCDYARGHGLSKTFLYSEQSGLNEDALHRHLKSSETVVLLLVVSGSSFHGFDIEHHPMTYRLKDLLTSKCGRLRIVVCPTTPADQLVLREIRKGLSQALQQKIQVWPGFWNAVEVPGQRALVDLRAAAELPAAPESVTLEYRGLQSVVVRWAPPSSGAPEQIGGYKVRMEYFDAHGSLFMEERQCGPQEMAAEFNFPESFCAHGGLNKVNVASLGNDLHEGQSKTALEVWSTRDSLQLNAACLKGFLPALAAILVVSLTPWVSHTVVASFLECCRSASNEQAMSGV